MDLDLMMIRNKLQDIPCLKGPICPGKLSKDVLAIQASRTTTLRSCDQSDTWSPHLKIRNQPTSSKYKNNPQRSHYQLLHALTTPPIREMGEITLSIGMAKSTRLVDTRPDPTLMGWVYLTRETIGLGLDSNNSTCSRFRSGSGIMHTCPEPNPHI